MVPVMAVPVMVPVMAVKGAITIGRRLWAWARLGGGAAILAVLIGQLGAEPFLDAVRLATGWPVAAAITVTVLTTVCCAWRWRLVAGTLGVGIRLPSAVAAYYRSQFLNHALPGGVLGDLHRGLRHGRDVGLLGRSLRSVGWERVLGQMVQVALTAVALLLLPTPVRSMVPGDGIVTVSVVVAGIATVVVAMAVLGLIPARRSGSHGPSPTATTTPRAARFAGTLADDLRSVLLHRTWLGIVLASAAATTGYVVIFLVAVRATGAEVGPARALPLALVVLCASAIPLNIAGWGPREGAAAWAFSAAGMDPAQGVTVAALYGVLVLLATLPGAALLLTRKAADG